MELVSIVVPIYKVEQYLERCVQSICNQTYPKLEIILVDDGSSDHINQWSRKDKLHLWILNYKQYWLMRLLSKARRMVSTKM